jgi:hypothetical protein
MIFLLFAIGNIYKTFHYIKKARFNILISKPRKRCFNMASNNNNSNQLLVPGVQQALDQMKYEIASEFGVQLGADTTSRANGSVGGEITKRLVQMAEQQMGGSQF